MGRLDDAHAKSFQANEFLGSIVSELRVGEHDFVVISVIRVNNLREHAEKGLTLFHIPGIPRALFSSFAVIEERPFVIVVAGTTINVCLARAQLQNGGDDYANDERNGHENANAYIRLEQEVVYCAEIHRVRLAYLVFHVGLL